MPYFLLFASRKKPWNGSYKIKPVQKKLPNDSYIIADYAGTIKFS